MSELLLGWPALAPSILLVTLATGLAVLIVRRIPSAAKRNAVLLPTLWLVCIAPFAPVLGRALDLSIELAILEPDHPMLVAPQGADAEATPTETVIPETIGPTTPDLGADDSTVATISAVPSTPIPWASILLALWIGGSCIASIRLAVSFWILRRLVRDAGPAPDRLTDIVERAGRLAGLRRYPELAVTDRIATPVAVGWGRAARVLLPTTSLDTMSEAEWIHALAHEGAHHAHSDPRLQIVRRLATALWWWHPLVHRLDREVDRAREDLADNAVLDTVDPLTYGETLLAWGRQMSSEPSTTLAVSLLPRHHAFEARIQDLLDPRRCTMTRSRPFALMIAIVLSTSLCVAAGATRLVDRPTNSDTPERSDSWTATGEQTLTFPGGAPGHLDVDIKRGDIRVSGHDSDLVIVRWTVPDGLGTTPRTMGGDLNEPLIGKPVDLDVRQSGSTIEVNSDDYEQITHIEVWVPHDTDLTLDSYRDGVLTVRHVQGVIRARSNHNDIVLEDVSGSAELKGYNGSLSAHFREVSGALSFTTYNGHVDLTFPDDVGLETQFRTERGNLRSAFQLDNVQGSIGRSSSSKERDETGYEPFARGTIGSGEHPVTIETTNGNIVLRKASGAAD